MRRARDGPLKNLSRKPHFSPRKTSSSLEELIVEEAKRTGFRYRRLSSYFLSKYGLCISENTVKAILRRNGIGKERKRKKGNYRHLYDYEALMPFREFQQDTKYGIWLLKFGYWLFRTLYPLERGRVRGQIKRRKLKI